MKKRRYLLMTCGVGIVLVVVLAFLWIFPHVGKAPALQVTASTNAPAHIPGTPIDGIRCEAMEGNTLHFHVHLTILVDGELKSIPEGIGRLQQPITCDYWLHTHDQSGIVHIESSVKRSFHLGDFFDIWDTPLLSTQVSNFVNENNKIRVFVNGQLYAGDPRQLELQAHQEITLEVGPDFVSPPKDYHFPSGL